MNTKIAPFLLEKNGFDEDKIIKIKKELLEKIREYLNGLKLEENK